uniref:Uncharacterized protein n=1 Tax=Tanacetum cinerariifolium TaxID=118510 RepID=A0A699GM07_TANCI|nr:hypothetical protein [Tanacetum cinerariifolium]
MDGLDAMLENGPWFIWNIPFILKKWHPNENLLKEDVSTVLVWVKLYGVPVTAFSDDGLSAIATKLENIIVAMPKITREDHYTCNVRVEYEWKYSSGCLARFLDTFMRNVQRIQVLKTVKKPSQASRGVPFGLKMAFKPQKEYRPVTKNPNTSSSGNEKKGFQRVVKIEVIKGYGTNSLLEQWRDSDLDNDDYDLYDGDMYKNHDLSEHICDDLDITAYSWSDIDERAYEEMNESCLMIFLNPSCLNKALDIDDLQNDNFKLTELNNDYIREIKALLREKRILQQETNKRANREKELELEFDETKGIKTKKEESMIRPKGKLSASFGVDAVEDFKEYTLRDYYCWLKTYCCWYKLKLLDNAADIKLRVPEESAAADVKMKK